LMTGKFQPHLVYNRNTKEDGFVRRVYEANGSVMYEVIVPKDANWWATGFDISDWTEGVLQASRNMYLKSSTYA
jgi:hypothetical protein